MSATDEQAKYDYKSDESMRIDVWDENLHVGYWDGPGDTSDQTLATERLTDLVLARSGLGAGQYLLDVGCGMGKPARRAATETGCSVSGVSDSDTQVERANEGAAAAGIAGRVGFQTADATQELPFPDAHFDVAWAIESLVHMTDRARALAHVARTLKPGGLLVATDFFTHPPLTGARADAVDAFRGVALLGPIVSLDDYPALLRTTGFELREFVDLTEHTHRTYALLLQALRDNEADLRAQHGDAVFDGFVTAFAYCVESLEPRYMLYVARRVADR